jgi:hypothetical protein
LFIVVADTNDRICLFVCFHFLLVTIRFRH